MIQFSFPNLMNYDFDNDVLDALTTIDESLSLELILGYEFRENWQFGLSNFVILTTCNRILLVKEGKMEKLHKEVREAKDERTTKEVTKVGYKVSG